MITATEARQNMSSIDDFYAIISSIEQMIWQAVKWDVSNGSCSFTDKERHLAFGVVNHLRNHGYHVTPHLNVNHEIMSIDINW